MKNLTRRNTLRIGAGAVAGSALAGLPARLAQGAAPEMRFSPEPDAALRVLRWTAFVPAEANAWIENSKKFTESTGIEVVVESESQSTMQETAAKAMQEGSGPDVIFGFYDDPHLYRRDLVDVTILASYLGSKYGGWYPICERYGTYKGRWIALPMGAVGTGMVYRRSHMVAAGFERFPKRTGEFLDLCRALAEKGTPPGYSFGHATGDANAFVHWILWSFGGKLVDVGANVVINSRATWDALEYGRELYQTFVPGTLSWLDTDNNKAFLSGSISLSLNSVSIYLAARNSSDSALQEMAEDIHHANMPVGPVGKPTELFQFNQAMIPTYSKYPNAALEYLRFMWEREQFEHWQAAASGFVCHPLRDYEDNSVWTLDPKYAVFKDGTARMLWNGFAGALGPASAQSITQFIVADMFADVATGKLTPKQSAARAEERAEAIYRNYRL